MEISTPSFPRYAHVQGKGKCRVLSHDKNGYFFLLTNRDERIYRHRNSFTFLPEETRPTHAE